MCGDMRHPTPEYSKNFEKGLEYQDFVVKKLYEAGIPLVGYSSFQYQVTIGENAAGVEIKFDDRMKDTGNVYIEVAEKSDKRNEAFAASGIYRNDNTWLYAIGDYSVIYLCGKTHLRQLYERERGKAKTFVKFTDTPTSQGMLLPQKYVEEKLALKRVPGKHRVPARARMLWRVGPVKHDRYNGICLCIPAGG